MEDTYQRGSLADSEEFKQRVRRAVDLMEKAGLDALLLTKPQNMSYLVGDGRLCAFDSGPKWSDFCRCPQK